MITVKYFNKLKYVILGATLAVALGFYIPEDDTSKKDRIILNVIYKVLNSSHFSPQEINDEFSNKVFNDFLESMDFNKRFLLASDISDLKKYQNKLDDELLNAELNYFEEAYSIYKTRLEEAESHYKEILSQPFDFTANEKIETDEEKLSFASSQRKLKERWRKYLKYRVLLRIEEGIEEQQVAEEKKDTAVTIRTFAELEEKARTKELETHDEWFKVLKDMDREDWIGMYMNSITSVYDPHSQYFPPERKEDFEISMTGQLSGIGAQLSQKGDYVTIARIITGSPCWKQGDLEVGDKITKVAQADGEPLDVVGMNVRKVVKYIRGEKGTEVRLTVKKVDGSSMIIPIVRDVVELEATFAKSAVIGEGKDKIGYIRLPKFYVDFYDKGNRNCADDVRAELEKLKKENVSGVILDLRNNGGGTLNGVVDIVGLFIDQGPVVQVKAPGRAPRVLKDKDRGVAYDGPLVVMVNQFSASASEIFAAAIQDYKRGVIIGSRSTFGKGTVQNVLDMDGVVNFTYNDVKPLGALKLTIQKYYRINGGTPQLRGVQPEIVLPDNYSYIDFGEKEQDYALPYDEIGSANYDVWESGTDKYPTAIDNSQSRVKENAKFQLIDDYARWLKEERENTIVNLNFEAFRKDQEAFRVKSKKYENMRKSDDKLVLNSNEADYDMWNENEDKKKELEKWLKGLEKDLYLHEAYAVANDLD